MAQPVFDEFYKYGPAAIDTSRQYIRKPAQNFFSFFFDFFSAFLNLFGLHELVQVKGFCAGFLMYWGGTSEEMCSFLHLH
jgi:hypothetical protein